MIRSAEPREGNVGKLKADTESFLTFEPDFGEPGKPLHEYAKWLLGKIEVLWSHGGFIAKVAFLCLAVAVGISFLLPVKYAATAYLMPPDMSPTSGLDLMIDMKSGGDLMGAMGGMGGALNDMLGMRSPGQLYIQEMQSRPVEESLVKSFDLNRIYHKKSREMAIKMLAANTQFDEDRKSGIISVKVSDKDPNRAAAIANAYAEQLGRLQSDIISTSGRREREYFEAQLAIARGQLEKSSQALSDFSSKNAALNLPLQDVAVVSSMSSVQGQLIAAQAEFKGLLPIYTVNNLRVREARAQIEELQRQLDQIRGRGSASNSPTSDKPSEAAPAGAAVGMAKLAGLSTEYTNLYRQAKTDETMVETLTQQYEISKLEESRHVAEVQLLDPAEAPERKSSPKRAWISLTGLLLGCLFAVIYVLTQDWWHNTSEENEWKKLLLPFGNKLRSRKSVGIALKESQTR
jgi:uncharacterized protein involved in exopolysaccharide biosynthesis